MPRALELHAALCLRTAPRAPPLEFRLSRGSSLSPRLRMKRNKEGENPAPLSQSGATSEPKTTYRRVAPKPMEETYDSTMMPQGELGKPPLPLTMARYLDPTVRAPMATPGVGLVPLGNPMASILPGAPALVQPYASLAQSFRSPLL